MGNFESYLQGVIGQVFAANVEQLASDKQLTYRELIENQTCPVEYLIEREVSAFGHLTLEGIIKFVRSRIKYDFNDDEGSSLREVYFIRNVVAHNSGFIRMSQQQLIPPSIAIKNNQIEIPIEYLEKQMSTVEATVERMDAYVVGRWHVPKSVDALFNDLPAVPTASQTPSENVE